MQPDFSGKNPRKQKMVLPKSWYSSLAVWRYQGSPTYMISNAIRSRETLIIKMRGENVAKICCERKPDHDDLLYVDCEKSIISMSKATLHNITYGKRDFENSPNMTVKVVYPKKIIVNSANRSSTSNIRFEIEVSMLSESFSNYF